MYYNPSLGAFFNNEDMKEEAEKRARGHKNAGRIVQGKYGELEIQEPGTAEFKGCAVGCLAQPLENSIIHDGFDNRQELWEYMESQGIEEPPITDATQSYEPLSTEFNFSYELSAVVDAIFETLDESDAKYWPWEFVTGLNAGAYVSGARILEIVERGDWDAILWDRFPKVVLHESNRQDVGVLKPYILNLHEQQYGVYTESPDSRDVELAGEEFIDQLNRVVVK